MSNRRTLGLTAASVTVVANMIGTGVFTTTGLMAEKGATSGDILLGWLIGGVIALCGALCYGEVGANLPHSGGEYYYLSRLLHPALGFISGVVSLVVGFAGPIAASSIALNLYIATVVPNWPVSVMAARYCRCPRPASWTRPARGKPISDGYHLREGCSDRGFRRRRLCNGTKHAIEPFPGSAKLSLVLSVCGGPCFCGIRLRRLERCGIYRNGIERARAYSCRGRCLLEQLWSRSCTFS